MLRKNPEPRYGVVPNEAPPAPPPEAHPTLRLTPGELARLEEIGFDELNALLHEALAEAYRQRRARVPALIDTTTVVRLNGLLGLARRMTRGLRRPVEIPALPETVLLSGAELVLPLERAVLALAAVETHRPYPHDPAFRGRQTPWVDPLATARA